jgi:diguanylate cyclase (GGDEF)-like protein
MLRRLVARAHELPLRHRSLRWTALALGIVLSVVSAWEYRAQLERSARLRFQVLALDKANDIELRLRAYTDVLYALRGLFDASQQVTRHDFSHFADALSVGERYPGLTNISYTFRVPGAGKTAFETAIRAGLSGIGAPPFAIKPPGERSEYAVLTYIEPMGQNIVAWGLDLNADPKRRAAVEAARDSGAVSSSTGVTLLRDNGSSIASILMRLAVYEGGGVPASLEDRRRLYRGLVGSTVRVDELIEAAVPHDIMSQMRIRVALGGAGADEALYDSRPRSAAQDQYAAYAVGYRITLADRDWHVQFTPVTDPVESLERFGVAAVLAVALAVSTLLFWLLSSLGTILRLRDELLEQAMHDPLTGLYNRRYMEEWLRHEVFRARRHGRPIGVIMIDVDHFKRINDRLGHEGGDVVLRELASVIRGAARASDIVCRYGGEEFVLLMPEAAVADAARKAEELRAAVERLALQSQGRAVGPLTISAGVTGFPWHAQDTDALLRCADEALYAAKRLGRNRVIGAKPPRAVCRKPETETAVESA